MHSNFFILRFDPHQLSHFSLFGVVVLDEFKIDFIFNWKSLKRHVNLIISV